MKIHADLQAMHEAFGPAFFHAKPGAPEDAIVYYVNAGTSKTRHTVMKAARFKPGTKTMIGKPFTAKLAKSEMAKVPGGVA